MKISIRHFNPEGLEIFKTYLNEMILKERTDLPDGFLLDKRYSVELYDNVLIDILKFDLKKELVVYLYPKIKLIYLDNLYYNMYLWSWLAAAYIDSICPKFDDGYRYPGALNRYILDPYSWSRYYRHLLSTPIRLYHELSKSKLINFYTYGRADVHGDVFEQLAARQEIAAVPGIIEAAEILYWDTDKNRPKTGAADRTKPGNLRRFTGSLIPQFQLTYDLNSMSGLEIIELLPKEFDDWRE